MKIGDLNFMGAWSKITERFGGGSVPVAPRLEPRSLLGSWPGSRCMVHTGRGHSSRGIIASIRPAINPAGTTTKTHVSGPVNPGYAGVVNPTNRRGQAQEGLQGWRLETLPRMILRSRYSLGIKRFKTVWSSFDLDFLEARLTRGQMCVTRLAKQRGLGILGTA